MEQIISIDIYDTDMLFVVGTQEDLKASLERHLDEDDAEKVYNIMTKDLDETLGSSVYLSGGQTALWITDTSDKGTLAHEIFHVVCYIMEKVGISLCHESDEAYAYLIGFITNKVNDVLNSSCESPSQ